MPLHRKQTGKKLKETQPLTGVLGFPLNVKLSAKEFSILSELIYQESRISLGDRKRDLLVARVRKRLKALNLRTIKEYLEVISGKEGTKEIRELINVVSTNHTAFFREVKHFEFLRDLLHKRELEELAPEGLRVWSAATSTGEEAYSLAIELEEAFHQRFNPTSSWNILATDISSNALRVAVEGIYARDRIEPIPERLQKRYLKQTKNSNRLTFEVIKKLKQHIKFLRLNLFDYPYPFTKTFHIIFCRNVMIYFDAATQRELIEHLSHTLAPGGYLFVGHSESLMHVSHSLKRVSPSVYQKV